MTRPRIAILGRFAEGTTVTRYRGLVTAQALAEAVWAAGGEPLTFLPVANSDWNQRMADIDGVLMPGGGDLDPSHYSTEVTTDEIYGVDALQDEADFELVKWAIDNAIPLLAICRGCQLVNVALGGNLVQHMDDDHRHKVHEVKLEGVGELGIPGDSVEVSCYHHQVIDPQFSKQSDPFFHSGDQADPHKFRGNHFPGVGMKCNDHRLAIMRFGFGLLCLQCFLLLCRVDLNG